MACTVLAPRPALSRRPESSILCCVFYLVLFEPVAIVPKPCQIGPSRPVRGRAKQILFCFLFSWFSLFWYGSLFLARPTPVPSQNAASSDAQFFPASKDEVNEIAIQNLLFGL
jgi:hypothetical protein